MDVRHILADSVGAVRVTALQVKINIQRVDLVQIHGKKRSGRKADAVACKGNGVVRDRLAWIRGSAYSAVLVLKHLVASKSLAVYYRVVNLLALGALILCKPKDHGGRSGPVKHKAQPGGGKKRSAGCLSKKPVALIQIKIHSGSIGPACALCPVP